MKKLFLLLLLPLLAGCPASVYAQEWPSAPSNAVEITADPIQAPTTMSNACGAAGYTVDDSSTPILRDPGDRDAHHVTFHCNDGSTPQSSPSQ
jgi:hypothetical protein